MAYRWGFGTLAVTIAVLLAGMIPMTAADIDPDRPDRDELAALRTRYKRPEVTPFPPENPYSEVKARLGQRLFFDTRLSGGDTLACASCHIPALGWEDGRKTAVGEDSQALERHTPTLWNLAWGEFFFWDGRAESLEAQALLPIEAEMEMNQPLEALLESLKAIPEYRRAFAAAFPQDPVITAENIAKAIATFERTLVSPTTAFDRWIAGDNEAIDKAAKRGFILFNTKANCAACHSGWSFTDHAFHDIGLPGTDRGRGAVLDLPQAHQAFKTPTLRDIARRAPYMHDGSLATLEEVIDHYSGGFIDRPTLSADMAPITLTANEKADLLAFLNTLTSADDIDIMPPPKIIQQAKTTTPVSPTQRISQRNKRFNPDHVSLKAGEMLKVLNDDTRTHNLRIHDPNLTYNSGAQEPGETVEIIFDHPGVYYGFCAIHPKMKLAVEVAD